MPYDIDPATLPEHAAAARTTESEEMYLIHVAMAREEGLAGPVPVRFLADALAVTPASANQMVRKLTAKGLVEYVPYRGVELTERGRRVASRVLRGRRLWGVFLAERLGFTADEADAIACDLEHITTPEVAQRLAHLLGEPMTGPGGLPIPAADGVVPPPLAAAAAATPLAGSAVGQTMAVVAVDAAAPVRSFLASGGVEVGSEIAVLAATATGALLITAGEGELHLDATIVDAIRVVPGGDR